MDIKKCCYMAVGAVLLTTAAFVNEGNAGVSVGIGINIPLPPPVVIAAPPALVVVPGTSMYVAPDIDADIVFLDGYWWRLNEGRWYRSPYYDRGWVYMDRGRVPRAFYGFHPGFRERYRGYERVHWNDVHRDWNRRHPDWDRRHSDWDRRHPSAYTGGGHNGGDRPHRDFQRSQFTGGPPQQQSRGGFQQPQSGRNHQQMQPGGSHPQGQYGGGHNRHDQQ